MAKTQKELIQAASIARVTDKNTGKLLGWYVKSNSSQEHYEVRCTKIAGTCFWTCSCKAGQSGFANCKAGKCCHCLAVIEVEVARRELKKQAAQAVQVAMRRAAFEQVCAEVKAIEKKYAKPAILFGRGFRVEAIPELGGRLVPMKRAS